jgi:2-haloacid dehalogenase
MIEAVVFDIGRVLIGWEPERFYDARIGPERRKALFAQTGLLAMNDQLDLGAPFLKTVTALAGRHPDWRGEIMAWHDHWIEMARPAIPGSVRLLAALKRRGMPVFALSNFGIGTFDLACRHYPFLQSFDRLFVSGRLGLVKPDPQIYAALETGTGLAGAQLLFTDDRPENIAVARARGWKTHLFDHPEGWAARLLAEGVLSPEEAA